jgi:hypothetical protein
MESSVALLRGCINNSASFQQLRYYMNVAVFGSEMQRVESVLKQSSMFIQTLYSLK